MPRARSSGRRSVSLPVSARTSHVLPWSMWPAVPTVSGMRRPRRRPRRAPRPRACGSRAAAGRRARSRHRRLVPAQRRGERLLDRAGERRQLVQRQRAAADARRPSPRPRRRRRLRDARRARAPLRRLAQHAQHRHLGERALGVEIEQQRPLERGEAELVDAQRAVERMAPQPLDEVGAADDDPRLRAAEQLVAAEADEVGAGGERRARRRLVGQVEQRAGAEVVEQRQRAARATAGELFERRLLGEADDAEVRLVHAEEQRGALVDRVLVVGGARAVRRPDLDEPRAGACEHVGDAEPVADLDQLAARDDHVASFRERGEREQQRAGVVVHDERRLGAGQPAQDRRRRDPGASRARPSARSYSRFE